MAKGWKTVGNSFGDLATVFGVKDRKPNAEKYAAQKDKFFKCKKCGNQMKLVGGNVLVCTAEVKDADGVVRKTKSGDVICCNNQRILDTKDASYADYLSRY